MPSVYSGFLHCRQHRVIRCLIALVFGSVLLYHLYYFIDEQWQAWEFITALPDHLSDKPLVNEVSCGCRRPLTSHEFNYSHSGLISTCDEYATRRGPNQKVLSYSLYGNFITPHNRYYAGLEMNVERIQRLYPGWVVRVYHSVDTGNPQQLSKLCSYWCSYPILDFCQVGRLPEPFGDISLTHGMVWRFLVLGDPLVERFLIRDIDSLPSQREVDAVQEWIASGKTWHFMRDNPQHIRFIMGGMWGGTNKNLTLTENLRAILLRGSKGKFAVDFDQRLLDRHLKPLAAANGDFLSHDSYTCRDHPHTQPWPSKREGYQFVGSAFEYYKFGGSILISVPCPIECRPVDHLDWIYC